MNNIHRIIVVIILILDLKVASCVCTDEKYQILMLLLNSESLELKRQILEYIKIMNYFILIDLNSLHSEEDLHQYLRFLKQMCKDTENFYVRSHKKYIVVSSMIQELHIKKWKSWYNNVLQD